MLRGAVTRKYRGKGLGKSDVSLSVANSLNL